ncbi:MAG: hypothetical protein ACK5MG_10965 [Bacteroidales bacterium]
MEKKIYNAPRDAVRIVFILVKDFPFIVRPPGKLFYVDFVVGKLLIDKLYKTSRSLKVVLLPDISRRSKHSDMPSFIHFRIFVPVDFNMKWLDS